MLWFINHPFAKGYDPSHERKHPFDLN